MLSSEENVDDPSTLDPDASNSSLNEVEKLKKTIDSDQCFIRYIV